ncbi:MAG: O-antigen ligase family protein [Bacteroidetes bacterium]|nr:O-antigen ligase family protein [Bacteroidota bacterium]
MLIKANLIKENMGLAGLILFQFGLIFSPFILSFSLVFLLVQPFLVYSIREVFSRLFSNKISNLLLVYFLLCLLGIFYTQDLNSFWKDLQLKLPLLILPMAFVYSKYYLKRSRHLVLYAFILFIFIAGLLSFIHYLINYEEINQQIFKAKPVPLIANINHIYYSFLLAFAILSGIILHLARPGNKALKVGNIIVIILNIVFIHTIAARTGLFAFYISLVILLIIYGFKANQIILTIAAMIIVLFVGFASVKYIPVLNNRYQKTLEDLHAYRDGGDINFYSISERIEYWDKSFKVFLSSPVIGVGFGDVKHEMREIFEKENSILELENRKGPHNQYLEILAGLGIIGLLVFMMILFQALKIASKQESPLFLAFLLISIVTFFVESTLERQAGISFFTCMILFLSRPHAET